MPPGAVTSLVPFVHVADVEMSAAFYSELGFKVEETFVHRSKLNWAFLTSHRAQLMLARSSEPIDGPAQGVLFYLYSHDLAALRQHLISLDLEAGPICDGSPGPSQEMRVTDPDGYVLMIAQIED